MIGMNKKGGINYCPFKSIVRNNLKQISSAFHAAGEVIPLGVSTYGLIVYGGTILVGKTDLTCRNALDDTFDVTSNLYSWSKVSAVPHTRKCLSNPMVHHNGTDKRNPNFNVYQDIQSRNNYSTAQLNIMGYKGNALRAVFCTDKIGKREKSKAVTVAHTREHQEALATM
jgi:hypothetical protein